MIIALLLGLAALLDLVLPHPVTTRAEFGTDFVGIIIGIGSALAGLFGGGGIDGKVKTALDGIRLVVQRAMNAMADFGQETGNTQSKATGILRRLWDVVVIGLIHHLDSAVKGLHEWLKTTLGPILRALLKMRKMLLDFYTHWFKPIFDTIDAIRGVLRALSLLHIKVAQQLDAQLGELEARLRKPILLALGKINEAINIIDNVVGLGGLFQRLALIESQWHYVGDMWSVLIKHSPDGVTFEQNDQLRKQTVTAVDATKLARDVNDYITTGAGELAPDVDAYTALFLASVNDA